MALDYTDPRQAVNFRDVGEWVNVIAGDPRLPTHRLYRGGTLRHIEDPVVFGAPKTVFNLQRGPDPSLRGVATHHFPIANDVEVYATQTPAVRAWLRGIVSVLAQGIEWPLYVHCLSGKDRTGVVIATFLELLGVDHNLIVEEYLLSDGEVDERRIRAALAGLRPIETVVRRTDLARIRSQVMAEHPPQPRRGPLGQGSAVPRAAFLNP